MFIYIVDENDTSSNGDDNGADSDKGDDVDAHYVEEEEKQDEKEIALDKEKKGIFKSKKIGKTKLEKSIELLSESFTNASKREADMMTQLEEKRHKQMLDHELRMKELDNERRREERNHEMLLLQMMCNNRNYSNSQGEVSFSNSAMYTTPPVMQYMPSEGNNNDIGNTYFKL
jgi:uncharacterized protein with gpF-like domain